MRYFLRLSQIKINYADIINTALIAMISLLWYFWLITQGVAMSPDSTHYLYFSIFIHNDFNLSYVWTVWPPAYPILLGLAQYLSSIPTEAAALISAFMLYLTLFFLNEIMRLACICNYLRAFAIVVLFLNINFLYIFHFAWSEGPFTAFFMAAVFFLTKHNISGHYRNLLYAAVFVSLTALTRYLGYSTIILFAIYIITLLAKRKALFKVNAIKYYALLLLSGTPSVLWIIRNYPKDKTFHGPRSPSPYSLLENWQYLLETIHSDNRLLLLLILIVLLILIPISLICASISRERMLKSFPVPAILIFSLAVLIYLALTLYSATAASFDRLGTRFFAPIYPFIAFLFAYLASATVHGYQSISKNATAVMLAWALLVISVLSIRVDLEAAYLRFSNYYYMYFTGKWETQDYRDLGYNRSSLKKGVDDWLTQQLSSNNHEINLLVLTDYNGQLNVRTELVRSFLYRRLADNYKVEYENVKGIFQATFMGDFGIKETIKFHPVELIVSEQIKDKKFVALVSKHVYNSIKDSNILAGCTVKNVNILYGISCN